jgi:sulfate adenylyltransferase
VTTTITPHGGALVDRLVPASEAAAFADHARGLPSVTLATRQLCDLELIGAGALSPLEGFMGARDYRSVLKNMRLASGLAWTVPVTLPVDESTLASIKRGSEVALRDGDGALAGSMTVEEIYSYDKEPEAQQVYATTDAAHPGVAMVLGQPGTSYVGGRVRALPRQHAAIYDAYYLYPRDVRARFEERGWKTIVAFQTRNPVHRAHEYLTKVALEMVDGLLLHPLVGETKSDDIPASVRMSCYEELLHGYFPPERVLLATNPAWMRYAGPKEAVFHAMVRRNYGCTHFIVGRDHAGVGSYYDTYAAHRIFDQYAPGELGIEILLFEHTFYCSACGGMSSSRTCPHPAELHQTLSGTAVRKLLAEGKDLPPEFTRPEVARVLLDAATNKKEEATA